MAALTLRSTKGSALTNAEVDGNFSALNADIAARLLASAFTAAGIEAQLGFTPYDSANPAGYLSSITGSQVTSALGFTPYNATNPSGFITSAGSTTGNAGSATKLATPRAINGVAFDGTAPITVADSTKLALAGGAMTGGITSSAAEALRLINDAGEITFWNSANSTRSGFLQGSAGGNVTLRHEGATGGLALGGNGSDTALVTSAALLPAADNARALGAAGTRWSAVFAAALTATTLNAATANASVLSMNRSGAAAAGLLWYSSNPATNTMWADYLANPGTGQGPLGNLTAAAGTLVTAWALRSAADSAAGDGWIWESASSSSVAPAVVAELRSSDGLFRPAGGLQLPGAKRLTFEAAPTASGQLWIGGDGLAGITRSATLASIVTTNGTLMLDPGTGKAAALALNSGLGTGFGNGAGAYAASMDTAGQLWKGSTFGAGDRYATLAQTQIWGGLQQFSSNKGSGVTLGASNTPSLTAFSNDGGAAFMSFLRNGVYAVNMGLDPDNVLRIGGWSAPANLLQLDMSGNLSVKAGFQTTMVALSAPLTDTTNGSTWYGIGRTSTDLFGGGGNTVQVGGYPGVRIATSGVNLDITPSAVTTGAPLSAGRLATGYDSGAAGSVNASNWFRTTSNTGLYFADVGYGLYPAQGDYGTVGTYGGGKGSWAGYSIAGGVVFMHNSSSSGTWGIYNDYNNTWMLQSDMSGNATFTGNVTAYSDERLKKDWGDLPADFIERLAGVKMGSYTRIDTGERQVGVGARSLRALMPEAVMQGGEFLSVAYGNAALASSVALARKVVELEARIACLEAA
jgi:hypothetical protein